MELIPKIGLLILQARVPETGDSNAIVQPPGRRAQQHLDLETARLRLDMWKNGIPVQIDISWNNLLLEHWILTYEPSGIEHPLDNSTVTDHTDLVLLVQLLYSHLRSLPLDARIKNGSIKKESLDYSITSSDKWTNNEHPAFPASQTGAPWVGSYTFRPAETSFGTVHLSLIFWRFHEGPVPSLQSSETVNERLSLLKHNQPVDDEDEYPATRADLRKKTKLHQMPTVGSPRPEPQTVRRIASMSELKLEEPLMSLEAQDDSSTFASPFPLLSSSAPVTIGSGLRKETTNLSDSLFIRDSMDRPSSRPSPSLFRSRTFDHPSKAHSTVDLFGSLLGSYEESILNGRMSTFPSRPIDFLAEIGVFGKGKCKPSLKCPPHVTLPCPATYYLSPSDNIPSPYVGLIDLENGLAQNNPPGLFRLPPKGMLQLIIKNPNKTVVKVFLVSYDLNDMPDGTKTFLRQKSYSQQSPYGLRYAIHLKFLCTKKRRIYLHQNIRVVFSHWMPDSSEKLRVTVTEASPKYCAASSTVDDDAQIASDNDNELVAETVVKTPLHTTTTFSGAQGSVQKGFSSAATTISIGFAGPRSASSTS